jgi:hypothetical protein
MIVRVSELMLGGYESVTYYCTLCNRPFKPLHEANEHARFCGKAVPTQPVFRSYTTAATFEEDDDTQVYKKPWVGLTEFQFAEIYNKWNDSNGSTPWGLNQAIEKALKAKNHG